MTRPYDAIRETITIRGKEMRVTPREICEFYNAPYYENSFLDNTNLDTFRDIDMDDVVKYLTGGKGIWNHRADIELPTNFNQTIMFLIIKMWM
ncbi:hypothetical protein Goshw_001258 [Gossypium schwendimanii]|uniref:Uncharacterized protein n=1 Tax=Gossypium schwendimanii TaxID=34291 RepID=A0A7J9NAP7_GOSSC|nr:hypothetical protein [Gossypium schwendimanii]